jgi:hypothetical protein
MTFVTSNQGRPIQGVSQQPPKNRLQGQCTKSDNFRPDVVRGLVSRPGSTKFGTLVGASMGSTSKWHHYKRNDEEYLIEVQATGHINVWSPDGTVHTVNDPDNRYPYLVCDDPSSELELVTIGDYTFMINKNKIVGSSAITSPNFVYQAIVYVQYMDYSQTIQVVINDTVVAWHKSNDGADSDDSNSVVPSLVADHLVDGMNGGSGSDGTYGTWGGSSIASTFWFGQSGNCIFINKLDFTAFSIYVNDSVNNSNAVALMGTVEQVTLLPNRAPQNFKIKVQPPGGDTTEHASYYLKASEATGTEGNTVKWVESIAPLMILGMDKSTMPHVLVRESISAGISTFTFRQGEWEDREVGDNRTNPLPSFVGASIKSMGVMQNRLYVTSGEAVVMSRSGEFFNFFRATTQASLDTDPIDVYADSNQINYLESSATFDGDVVFFSKESQFILAGDKILTPQNAVLRKSTNFESVLTVKPVTSGDSIFFPITYGMYTGVREYFTDSLTDTKRARPVTDHVKEYIKGNPKLMITSTNLNTLLIKADAGNILYTYDWLWQGTEKVQSAWGRFIFTEGDNILFMVLDEDQLKLVITRDNETVNCEVLYFGDSDSASLTFPVRLDRLQEVTFTKDTDDIWKTSDVLPNVDENGIKIVRSTGCYESELGSLISFYREDDELWSEEDLSEDATCKAFIGVPISHEYIPTNPVVKDHNGMNMNLDVLVVGAYYINYNTSGEITVTITDDYGASRSTSYSNRTLGGPENIIGFAPLVDGQHRVPVRKRSDKYTLTMSTESHVPLAVRDFSFNGDLNKRGLRI